MKILATILSLFVCLPVLAADEVAPPPPENPPKKLTDEEIAAAEAWANEILRQDMKMVELPAEDRARYEGIIEEVRTALGKGMAALKVKDGMEAGKHYVAARKLFNDIPREAGPSLGADYHKMSRAMLAFARILLELEAAEVRKPTVEDIPEEKDARPVPETDPAPRADALSNQTAPKFKTPTTAKPRDPPPAKDAGEAVTPPEKP